MEAEGAHAAREKARRELVQVEQKISGMLAAIEGGMYQPSMTVKISELEAASSSPYF